jgi:hypothetical protein
LKSLENLKEKKKNYQIYRSFDGRVKKKFWKILENFGKFGLFWNSETIYKDFIEICQIFTQFSLNLVNESFVPATHRTSIL